MACLGCNKTCACYVSAGPGITVSGTGNTGAPWVISAIGASEFTTDTCSISLSGDGALATPLAADLNIATAGGLKCTNAIGVGIKVDPAGTTTVTFSSLGIKISNGPIFVTAPCLVGDGTVGDPIHIVYDPDGGVFCDSDGVSIKLNTTCLALSSSGLAVVIDPDGGLECDTDGLAIKLDPGSTGVTFSTDGILITGGGGGGTVIADAPIIGDGSGGDHLRLDLLAAGGLDVSGGKLEILLDPLTDPSCGSLSAAGLLISCGGGGGAGTVIVEDTFVRANEDPPSATPIGNVSPKMNGSSDWKVVSNKLASTGSISENIIWWQAASQEYVFECTVDVQSTDGGVIWGMDPFEAGLGTYLLVNQTGVGTNYTLYYRAFGGFTSLGTGIAPTVSANGDVLKLIVDGINWSFWINGVKNWDTVGQTGAGYAFAMRQAFQNAGFRDNNDTAFRCSHIKITSTCCGGGSGDGLYTVDLPAAYVDAFGAAPVYDTEFDRTTNPTALPTGWVFQNQNSATYLEQLGVGIVSIASGFNTVSKLTCIVQPVSAAGAYTAVGKARTHYSLGGPSTGISTGLVLTDGTKAAGILFNTNPLMLVALWDDINGTYNSNPGTGVMSDAEAGFQLGYYRIIKHNANSYDFAYSKDGVLWLTLLAAYDVGAFMTPTHFGFLFRQGSGAQQVALDWFRVR